MTAKLEKALKRELLIDGEPYVVTIAPEGLKLVPKGKRKGYELDWKAMISGEAALATAMTAMLAKAPDVQVSSRKTPAPKKRAKATKH